MVGKLFKYEAKFYLRLFIPFGIIVLASALFMRTVYAFQSDSTLYYIGFGSARFLFIVSIFVCFGAVVALAITRFFKNLYGSEGYLSFTLPVTATEHICAKLFAALTFLSFALLVAFCGFCVATAGELLVEYFKAAVYIVKALIKESWYHTLLFATEVLLLVPTAMIFNLMIFYTCISLGQTAKRARVFMAFLYYFIYYTAVQILVTAFLFIAVVGLSPLLETIITYIDKNADWLLHVFMWGGVLLNLGFSALLFAINRRIMAKKLNLE